MVTRQRERTTPRISANKLGEYLISDASRRKSIIIDQIQPKDYVVARYSKAQASIVQFLSQARQDKQLIFSEINRLASASASSSWEDQNNQLCIDALEAFLNIVDDLELGNMVVVQGKLDPPKLTIANVAVSVRPDLLTFGMNRSKQEIAGAIKLHFSKGHTLGDEGAKYVATILHGYVDEYTSGDKKSDINNCLVIDIFGGKATRAPINFKKRMTNTRAACEEIKRAWQDELAK